MLKNHTTLVRQSAFPYFIENWMKENKNYHHDWCWTKDKVFMDGCDITEDLFELMLIKMFEMV